MCDEAEGVGQRAGDGGGVDTQQTRQVRDGENRCNPGQKVQQSPERPSRLPGGSIAHHLRQAGRGGGGGRGGGAAVPAQQPVKQAQTWT